MALWEVCDIKDKGDYIKANYSVTRDINTNSVYIMGVSSRRVVVLEGSDGRGSKNSISESL